MTADTGCPYETYSPYRLKEPIWSEAWAWKTRNFLGSPEYPLQHKKIQIHVTKRKKNDSIKPLNYIPGLMFSTFLIFLINIFLSGSNLRFHNSILLYTKYVNVLMAEYIMPFMLFYSLSKNKHH